MNNEKILSTQILKKKKKSDLNMILDYKMCDPIITRLFE